MNQVGRLMEMRQKTSFASENEPDRMYWGRFEVFMILRTVCALEESHLLPGCLLRDPLQ